MSLLSQVLPGLRELRTPLAAGYVWLVMIYLIFSRDVPDHIDELPTPLYRIFTFIQGFGWGLTGAVISSCVYLLGVLAITLTQSFPARLRSAEGSGGTRRRFNHERWPGMRDVLEYSLSERFLNDEKFKTDLRVRLDRESLIEALTPGFRAHQSHIRILAGKLWRVPQDLDAISTANDNELATILDPLLAGAVSNIDLRAQLISSVINVPGISDRAILELETFPEQLLVAAPAVHERWDRLNAEAEFRLGLAPPLLLLPFVVYSLWSDSADWLTHAGTQLLLAPIGLVPAILLFWSGREKQFDARRQLIGAWRAEVVKSPTLTGVRDGKILWLERSEVPKIQESEK